MLIGVLGPINTASAQVYDGANFPAIGRQYDMLADSLGYNVGLNRITGSSPWYLPLKGGHYANANHFLDPTSTSLSYNYPSASVVVVDSLASKSFSTQYVENIAGSYYSLGGLHITSPPNTKLLFVYNKPLTWLELPIKLGNFSYDTAVAHILATGAEVGDPVDSVRIVSRIFRHDTVDAVGTLTFPGLILENVIRRVRTDSIVDSVFTKVSGVWSYDPASNEEPDVEITIDWFHADYDWIVAQAIIDDNLKSYRYIKGPSLSTRLEISGLPTDISVLDPIPSFQAKAYDITTGAMVTGLTDSIRIGPYPDTTEGINMSWVADAISVMPIAGVATFENLRFHQPGFYQLLVWSDTLKADTSAFIHVHPATTYLELSTTSSSTVETGTIPPFSISAMNAGGVLDDYSYQGVVRVGKLSGPGELLGTLTQPLVNGMTTFDDLKLSHQGDYELVFFVPANQPYLIQDTMRVSVSPNPGTWTYHYTDTLSQYVDRASEFMWFGNADGYLSGTGRGAFSEVGQHFDFVGTARLTKVRCYFAGREVVDSHTDTFEIRIYDAGLVETSYASDLDRSNFMDSIPITLLGSQTFLADSIRTGDYWIRRATTIEFENPPLVNSSFVVSLVGNIASANDTIILWNSIPGDGLKEYRVMHLMNKIGPQQQDTMWVRTAYSRPSFNADLMIEAILEIDTLSTIVSIAETQKIDVTIYPNPTLDKVNVWMHSNQAQPVYLEVYTGSRRVISQAINTTNSTEISLRHLPAGSYILRVRDRTGLLVHTETVIKLK